MTDTPDDNNVLEFDPSNYTAHKPEEEQIRIGSHHFRIVDKLDSYTALALRDMAIENFIHEDDRERFLDTWEEEEWLIEMMTEIAERLGKAFSPKKKGNRAQRRGRR